MNLTKKILYLLIILLCASCIIVKEKTEFITKENETLAATAPKPTIKMSDKTVRTSNGDMLALLPENWFFVDVAANLSAGVFAIAVNPTYTVSAVFSELKSDETKDEIVVNEELLGLARLFFSKHNLQSTGGLKLIDEYKILNIGLQKIASYSFIREKDNAFGKSAVFISRINKYYEISLISLNISNNDATSRNEFDEIYNSILATLKY